MSVCFQVLLYFDLQKPGRKKKKAVGKLPNRLKFYPPPKQALVVPYTRVMLAYTPR